MTKLNEDWKGSDDESDEERTIKSGDTKRAEAIAKILERLKKHANTGDFGEIETDLAAMETEIKKNGDNILEEKGTKLPVMMLKVFMLLEETISEVTNEQKKKFNKAKSVSYNRVKQRFRKWLQAEGEGDENFEKQLANYKLNPIDEAEAEADDDSSEDEPKKGKGKDDSKKAQADD